MRQIVNRKDGRDTAITVVCLACRCQPHHSRRGMPVMRMEHVGFPAEHIRQFERGAREEREAIGIVVIAVDIRAVKQMILGDEVDGYVTARQHTFEDPCRDAARARGHDHAPFAEMDLTRASLRLDLWIGGHDHAHIVTERTQSFGQ